MRVMKRVGGGELKWRVNTPGLLNEILLNPATAILAKPLNIFGKLLALVGERAVELNDPVLNGLMCRLAIYSLADPNSPDYDSGRVSKILELAEQIHGGEATQEWMLYQIGGRDRNKYRYVITNISVDSVVEATLDEGEFVDCVMTLSSHLRGCVQVIRAGVHTVEARALCNTGARLFKEVAAKCVRAGDFLAVAEPSVFLFEVVAVESVDDGDSVRMTLRMCDARAGKYAAPRLRSFGAGERLLLLVSGNEQP